MGPAERIDVSIRLQELRLATEGLDVLQAPEDEKEDWFFRPGLN